jgi:hypothetical protein
MRPAKVLEWGSLNDLKSVIFFSRPGLIEVGLMWIMELASPLIATRSLALALTPVLSSRMIFYCALPAYALNTLSPRPASRRSSASALRGSSSARGACGFLREVPKFFVNFL